MWYDFIRLVLKGGRKYWNWELAFAKERGPVFTKNVDVCSWDADSRFCPLVFWSHDDTLQTPEFVDESYEVPTTWICIHKRTSWSTPSFTYFFLYFDTLVHYTSWICLWQEVDSCFCPFCLPVSWWHFANTKICKTELVSTMWIFI